MEKKSFAPYQHCIKIISTELINKEGYSKLYDEDEPVQYIIPEGYIVVGVTGLGMILMNTVPVVAECTGIPLEDGTYTEYYNRPGIPSGKGLTLKG